ncbi:hypothetical protein [Saccharopolyspora cebuensis]|uniref:Branched-chain amino acid ABC transporter permease n=1 Tax=Saccharopolyspora cebuensis TaxID=418759 RepID=A0ABV4CKF2_9PSEU
MTASSDQPERGRPAWKTILRSSLDGALIGAGAGIAYAIAVALYGAVASAPNWEGFAGVAAVAGLVAVPVGIALGTVFGTAFGLAARLGLRHLPWVECAVVAVFGGLVLALVITGSGQVNSGVLVWGAGPLVAGVPAAALHGWRLQRRTA